MPHIQIACLDTHKKFHKDPINIQHVIPSLLYVSSSQFLASYEYTRALYFSLGPIVERAVVSWQCSGYKADLHTFSQSAGAGRVRDTDSDRKL